MAGGTSSLVNCARQAVPYLPTLLYQHPGSYGCLSGVKEIETGKEYSYLVLDSQVFVHFINREGSRTRYINHVMIAIFQLARKRYWYLPASHLERARNVIEDSLSRSVPLESERSLDDKSFQWTLDWVLDLQVGLFVTESNYKLKCYIASNCILWRSHQTPCL